jgi:hypothetical protein
MRTLTSDGRCYQCGFPQLKPEDRYWATHSLMGLIWYLLLAGPARGQLHLLYQNSEVNEQFVLYFAKWLCAHIYQYLCKEKHFTCRCCQAILSSWFEAKEGLRAMSSSWDSATYRGTPLQCLPHQAYVQDMAKLSIVDITPELLQEMSD